MPATALRLFVLTLTVATLSGCHLFPRSVAEESVVDRHGSVDEEFEFWDEVTTRSSVSNHDALHGLLLVVSEAEAQEASSYEDRVQLARARGWLPEGEAPIANESATVGLISKATCEILDIKGGLTMRLLGRISRYCTRELVYLEIIPNRTENQALTGLEFVDLVGRIEDALGEGEEE